VLISISIYLFLISRAFAVGGYRNYNIYLLFTNHSNQVVNIDMTEPPTGCMSNNPPDTELYPTHLSLYLTVWTNNSTVQLASTNIPAVDDSTGNIELQPNKSIFLGLGFKDNCGSTLTKTYTLTFEAQKITKTLVLTRTKSDWTIAPEGSPSWTGTYYNMAAVSGIGGFVVGATDSLIEASMNVNLLPGGIIQLYYMPYDGTNDQCNGGGDRSNGYIFNCNASQDDRAVDAIQSTTPQKVSQEKTQN
jgi:hypothetical protein